MKKSVIIIRNLSIVFALSCAPSIVLAQTNNNSNIENKHLGLPKITTTSELGNFYANFDGQSISSDNLISHLGEWLGGKSDDTFVFVKSSTDDLNIKRDVYQHYYKGIKVVGELIFVHQKNDKITYVNGEFTPNINLEIQQPLSKEIVEAVISADMNVANITFSDFSQAITKVTTNRGVSTHLVTQVQAYSLSSLKAFVYSIDNTTKKVVKKLSKIYDQNQGILNESKIILPEQPFQNNKTKLLIDTPSSSATFYKGNQPITVDSYNAAYRLKDNARNIHTLNGTGWDGAGIPATGLTGNITEYTSATPNFTATDTKPPVEVHWAMKTAHDYYTSRHNRNSYDGNGSIIRNYYNINFGTAAAPMGMNAAALDISGIVAMLYGNGFYATATAPTTNLNYFKPFVGLDVAGHEYSHLMISRTANLNYEGESGALNESFADMFGAAIEFYSNITPNWTIGEGIPNPAIGFTFLRSMSAPKTGPAALSSNQPDTYGQINWANTVPSTDPNNPNDNGGVHTNSGVGNKWFYLLSVGGSGTNDLGTAYNVTGITIQKAEKIAFRTLATYLTPNSQYINAYISSKQAAIDLYGVGSNELQQVENAWCAVGLGSCSNLLAVNENVKNDSDFIKIYPNPIKNGQFTIENTSKEASFEIYDLSGKLIKSIEKLEKGRNEVQINDATAGVYLVKIQTDGKTITKKIVNK